MKALDTNVLVRYLVQDDTAQAKRAGEFIEAAVEEDGLLIGNLVLCELVWVLGSAYAFDKADILNTLDRLLETAGFHFESKDLVRNALNEYRGTKADFSDCLIGRIHQSFGCEKTVTFDVALRKLRSFEVL